LKNTSNWIFGGASAVMGIAALFVASNAAHAVGYYGGLAMFAFAVLFIFHLMKTSFDHA
jgi:hypothetical protein